MICKSLFVDKPNIYIVPVFKEVIYKYSSNDFIYLYSRQTTTIHYLWIVKFTGRVNSLFINNDVNVRAGESIIYK